MHTLQQLSDRAEISDVLARYCFAVDDRDWDAYRMVFTADAVIDDVVTGGIRSGVEEHIVYLKRALSRIPLSQHSISTTLITLDGDRADARIACTCPLDLKIAEDRRQVFFMGVEYRNKLVRTPDGWRIAELIETRPWVHNMPEDFAF